MMNPKITEMKSFLTLALSCCLLSSSFGQQVVTEFTVGMGVLTGTHDVVVHDNGNLTFVGVVPTGWGNPEIRLYHFTPEGDELWGNDIGTSDADGVTPNGVRLLPDGNLAIAAYNGTSASPNNWLLYITNENGHAVHTRAFPSSAFYRSTAMTTTSDDGILLAGLMPTDSAFEYAYIKTDETGAELWRTTWDYAAQSKKQKTVLERSNGQVYGFFTRYNPANDRFCIGAHIMEANGTKVDEPMTCTDSELIIERVVETSDQHFVIAGKNEELFETGLQVVKLDANLQRVWAFDLPDSPEYTYDARGLTETEDGGFLVVGARLNESAGRYEGLILRLDASGDEVWRKVLGATNNAVFMDVESIGNEQYHVYGNASSGGFQSSHWLVTIQDNTVGIAAEPEVSAAKTWPQPASNWVNFTVPTTATAPAQLEVFSLAGERVASTVLSPAAGSAGQYTWDMSSRAALSAGMYLYRLQTSGSVYAGKLSIGH